VAFTIVTAAGLVFILAPLIVARWVDLNLSTNWLIIYFLLYQLVAVLAYSLILALPAYLSSKARAPLIWFGVVLTTYLTVLCHIFSAKGITPPNILTAFIASIMLGEIIAILALFIYLAEEVAHCVEYNLPRRLRSGDTRTNAWLTETTNEIAAALREQKKMLLIFKPGTRTQFLVHITTNLIHAFNGNWDELTKDKPEKIPFSQIWRTRVAELLRMLFAAGSPLILMWGVQQTSLALRGTLFETIIIIAIIWAILSLLAAFDPLYSAKIVSLKDIVQFLPMPGKVRK
jgi:hypothetical protein